MNFISHCRIVALLPLLLLGACQHHQHTHDVDKYPLFNAWRLDSDDAEVLLLVRPDKTFHVDLLSIEGIEVEGVYELDRENREIVFINQQGSDPISSDPSPGVYRYAIAEDRIHFERLDDPIERRVGFLSRPWRLHE